MKKKFLIGVSVLSFIVLLVLGVYIYNVFKYANGELEDSQRIFRNEKNYLLRLSFDGKIQVKKDEVLFNQKHRYSIRLILYKFNPKPSIGQRQYPTYYEFINDSTLHLSVSQTLFNQIETNQRIQKKSADYFVDVSGKKIQLLSNDKDKWLP